MHSLACWDKFFVHNPLYVKESDDLALEIAFHLSGLFWPWWHGAFPLGGLSLCLRVVTVNPALITSDDLRQECFIVGGKLTKLSADIDALLLLDSCQDPGHKFGCDMVHAQFFLQNTLACPITNFYLLSNVVNSPTLILTDELLNLCNSFRSCATCGSPCVFVVVNWCATGLEPGMPLKRLCTTQALVPEYCWIILRVSVALFLRLAQNLMHTRCSFLWSIVKIATGHVHDSTQTRVKTAHVIRPTWYLARWLAKHGSPTIYWCFTLPQLLYRWWHQYKKFWINPCTCIVNKDKSLNCSSYNTIKWIPWLLHCRPSLFLYFNTVDERLTNLYYIFLCQEVLLRWKFIAETCRRVEAYV